MSKDSQTMAIATSEQSLTVDQRAEIAAHTPGPWRALPPAEWSSHDDQWVVPGVALCGRGELSEGNARLIAAAPDMLAALREYVAADDETQRTVGGDRDEHDRAINRLIDAGKQAIAAIAKAGGR